jgi:hypothetical protein
LTVYHKAVRYKLHKLEVANYRPTHPGINYTPGDYDFINNEVTISYSCSDHPMLPPEQRRTMEDIEDEIRRMEPRLVKDNHVDLKLPFHEATKFVMDHHVLDREYDYLRSKAVMVHDVKIPKIEIKEINKFYEKQKEKVKPLDEHQEIFQVGEVID